MAVERIEGNETLIIEFDGGMKDGKQRYKRKNISNLNNKATDEAIYRTAQTLISLQALNPLAIKMRGTDELINL